MEGLDNARGAWGAMKGLRREVAAVMYLLGASSGFGAGFAAGQVRV